MFWALIFGGIGLAIALGGATLLIRGGVLDRRGDFAEGYFLGGSLLVTFGLVVGLAVGLPALFADRGCERYGRELGVSTTWELAGGCYVEVPGQARRVPQSWIVPVIEGERIRLDVQIDGD